MIKKIFDKVINIEKDKLLHYLFGLLIMGIPCVIINIVDNLSYGGVIIAVIISIIIVWLKEVYDESHKGHTYELEDIVYGFAGIITQMLIIILLL